MTTEQKWQRVLDRDRSQDGRFFYAVKSTGIFCRPSCPSRRPRRRSVEFFDSVTAAQHAGFRPCRRCKPTEVATQARAIRAASTYIDAHLDEPLRLAALADAVGLSPFHLHRLFRRELGVTPRQYHEAQRMKKFKRELGSGRKVTDAVYEAGFGSASRLYEKAGQLGMKPSAYRAGGAGQSIAYTMFDSELGKVLLAATEKGVCALRFADEEVALERELASEFPAAQLTRDDRKLARHRDAVLDHLADSRTALDLPLDVRATAFQRRVWEILQAIPAGETRSYSEVAHKLGDPNAVRAVARACATNPVALVIPCHRVVRTGGALAGYRWGIQRKSALLQREKAPAKA
jgi:AraC family transcriptional regulator of adaptative response/methylated-DNA-[protein]-cysteine methyltransferase